MQKHSICTLTFIQLFVTAAVSLIISAIFVAVSAGTKYDINIEIISTPPIH